LGILACVFGRSTKKAPEFNPALSWSEDKSQLHGKTSRALGSELVLLNLNGCPSLLQARDTSARDQFQMALVVQLRRPTDRNLEPLARKENLICREEDAVAADVYCLTSPFLVIASLVQDFVANLSLDGKSIRVPSFGVRVAVGQLIGKQDSRPPRKRMPGSTKPFNPLKTLDHQYLSPTPRSVSFVVP
jgi:hypothetical protein